MSYRAFVKPTQTQQRDFILHSCLLEQLNVTQKDIADAMALGPRDGNPHAIGHFQAVNSVIANAHRDDLIPSHAVLQDDESLLTQKMNMLRVLHTDLFMPIAENSERLLGEELMNRADVGVWRRGGKKLGPRRMPDPFIVPKLVKEWMLDLALFHDRFRLKLDNPMMLDQEDLFELDQMSYEFHLRLCCIKPFDDGSNRVARLVYELLRLNWGLQWIVLESDQKSHAKLLNDIWAMQDLRHPQPDDTARWRSGK